MRAETGPPSALGAMAKASTKEGMSGSVAPK